MLITLLLVMVLRQEAVLGAVIITAGPDPAGRAEVQSMISNSEQRSWCRPGQIRQIITHANCESKEVENQVCAGSCFSYSLPQTVPLIPGDEDLDFCESCRPSQSHWINITLECTDEDDGFYEVSKRVQQITNCSCSSCFGARSHAPTLRPESSSAEDSRISDLLSRALPIPDAAEPTHKLETVLSGSPAAAATPAASLTPTTALTSSAVSTTTSTASPSSASASTTTGSPSTTNRPLNAMLMQEVVPLTLDHSSHYDFPGPYVLQEEIVQHAEDESNPNVLRLGDLSEVQDADSVGDEVSLTSLMGDLNALLKGEGPVQYQELTINQLKAVVNNLKSNPARLLRDNTVYSALPMQIDKIK
ncbi:uncharacterized protein LOC108665862 [Hyalella azteca]|uniref:Uncharacterized protein LOC108665862 n=1 Tax=Hyalella azteca TaxID=294128 RepID=A0A8B7N3J5_HYAAZ|nr:uncharacterized protein LOC108665862 [Hyalella azteca]